jgi:acyl-CoA thioester hydrolase
MLNVDASWSRSIESRSAAADAKSSRLVLERCFGVAPANRQPIEPETMGGEGPKPADGIMRGREHLFPLRVYFEDTDVAGIVYYANYLRFIERARSDMLRLVGIDQRGALEGGQGVYAVAEVNVRYRAPAKLGDDLVVVTGIEAVRAATVLIQQRVMRGDELLADARVTAAFLTPDGRPQRQPGVWVDAFKRLTGEG